jgi:hypothetical protein
LPTESTGRVANREFTSQLDGLYFARRFLVRMGVRPIVSRFLNSPATPTPLAPSISPSRLQAPSSLLEPALAHSLQAPARSLHRRSGAHPVEHVRKPKITPRPGRTGPDSPVRHATPPIRQLTALELFRCLRRAPAKNQPTLPLVPSLSLLQRFSRAVRRSRILPIRPQFHFKIARKP